MQESKKLNTKVFKRLLAYSFTYKKYFFAALFFTILMACISPYRVKLIGYMVDEYITKSKNEQMLFFWSMVIVGLLILEAIVQFLGSYTSNLLAQSIVIDIRKKLFAHIQSFRMKYFDKNALGGIVTRLISDLEAISEVFSAGFMNILGDSLMLIVVVATMLATDIELSLYVLLPIPLLLFATRIFARAMRKSYQLEREQVNKLNTFVQERVSGMNLVQLFSRQEQEFEKFKEINAGHREAHIRAIWANSIFFPVVELLSSLSITFLYVFTIINLTDTDSGSIKEQFGRITEFTLFVYLIYRPIRQLADKFNVLQRGTVRAERVFETLDREDNIQNSGSSTSVNFSGDISIKDLYFSYTDEDWVLKDIQLTIPAGSSTAFVGATGAGKSSIVNLICRFYEYQKGSICIDGQEITEIELSYLRRNIAIVLQDVFLFSDTIFNNITLRDPNITLEQVIEAAKAVGAHEFIQKLPGGYEYQVGERGGVLSSGQRQLLSFIRAYVYNPEILILDEATSSVDNESEEMIQRATAQLTKGRTSIIIAHRLSTIVNANRIVVLDKGEIKEQGTHSELLETDGYYRRLFDMQFGDEENKEER